MQRGLSLGICSTIDTVGGDWSFNELLLEDLEADDLRLRAEMEMGLSDSVACACYAPLLRPPRSKAWDAMTLEGLEGESRASEG